MTAVAEEVYTVECWLPRQQIDCSIRVFLIFLSSAEFLIKVVGQSLNYAVQCMNIYFGFTLQYYSIIWSPFQKLPSGMHNIQNQAFLLGVSIPAFYNISILCMFCVGF